MVQEAVGGVNAHLIALRECLAAHRQLWGRWLALPRHRGALCALCELHSALIACGDTPVGWGVRNWRWRGPGPFRTWLGE